MGATGRVYLHVRTAHFRRAKMVTSMLRIYLPIINNFFKKTVVLGHIHKVLQIKEMTFLSVCVGGGENRPWNRQFGKEEIQMRQYLLRAMSEV